MTQISDKEYAAYMLANYTLGYIDTAIFIGANLFEKYFYNVIPKNKVKYLASKKKKKYLQLWEYIDLYIDNGFEKQDILYHDAVDLRSELHKFRELRNDLIHSMSENKIIQEKTRIGKFILYIYFSYHKEQKYDKTIILESGNNTLLQDYKIKEITERMIARMEKGKIPINSENVRTFEGLNTKDFNNLFELRKKLRYLQRNLEKEMAEIGLVPTILSPIDTTSAYIWMPFIDKEFTDTINKFSTQRNNLIVGSTSILATPIDFRVYIDFGGGDYEYRIAFQDFLQSHQFITYIQQYKDNQPILKIFDIEWYSFIVSENSLFEVISQGLLKTKALKAKKIIKREQEKENIITSGYNRIGFILPKSNINKQEIIILFKKIAHIYYEFLIYKFQDDPDVGILKDAQKLINN